MGDDDFISPQSNSIRGEDSVSDSGSDTEAETLLSSHSQEEPTAQDIEKAAGPLKEKGASDNIQFLIWTCVNTLATIGIVSIEHSARLILTISRFSPTSRSSRMFTFAEINPRLQLSTLPSQV